MTRTVQIGCLLACGSVLAACSVLLDPDELSARDCGSEDDAADVPPDETADTVEEVTTVDPLLPDAPEDVSWECEAGGGFEDACTAITCPDPLLPAGACGLGREVFNDLALGAGFILDDPGGDGCASLCQCRGFATLSVPGGLEHVFRPPDVTAPAVGYPTTGFPERYAIEARVVAMFDAYSQTAGVFAYEDENNMIWVAIDHVMDRTQVTILAWEDASSYPDTDVAISIPVQETLTDLVLALGRTGTGEWQAHAGDLERSFLVDIEPQLVGVFASNSWDDPGIPAFEALFDYICIEALP